MKKKFIIFSMLFFLFPFVTKAANLTSTMACNPSTVNVGNTVICNVTITNTLEGEETFSNMNSFSASISASEFQLTKITPATNWTSNSNTSIDLINNTYQEDEENNLIGFSGTLQIATLEFKVNTNASAGNKTISLSGGSLTSQVRSNTIKILSSNNNLSSLSVAGKTIDLNSNTDRIYSIEINQTSAIISATKADNTATFKTNYAPRTITLNYGTKDYQIIVVSENNKEKIYTLRITRQDERSQDNFLSSLSLSIGELKPGFNKTNLAYDVAVSSNIKTIEIMAEKEHSNASFITDYGPRTVNLEIGLNTFFIQVKSEKGETRTYTLNITRSDDSSNNYLKSIALTSGQLQFDKNILEYNINVLYDVLEMEVSGIAEDETAKMEVYGIKSLKVGLNKFTIKVTAQNNSVRNYIINVTRLESGKTLSTNNYLKALVISNYDINFNKEVLEYDLKIKKEDALSISYTLEDETAVVKIIGNKDLKNESKIKIVVTSEDGKSKIYQINIIKDKSYLSLALYIAGGIIVGVGTILLIFKNKIFKKSGIDQIVSQDSVATLKGKKLILNQDTQIFKRPAEIVPIPDTDEPTTFEEK